jgi:hypothetical protein
MKIKGVGELSGTQKIAFVKRSRFSEKFSGFVPRTQRSA